MKINAIYSGKIYEKMMNAPAGKRDDLYRYEMMKPFEYKWACINVPIKAARKGSYDVVMASEMMGLFPPERVDHSQKEAVEWLKEEIPGLFCKGGYRTAGSGILFYPSSGQSG